MKAICTFCGHANRADAPACSQCGGSLANAPQRRFQLPWAFEQFLASRPEPKAMKAAASSIRHIASLISGYVADMAEHGARPAPWNEPERKSGPASEDHATPRP